MILFAPIPYKIYNTNSKIETDGQSLVKYILHGATRSIIIIKYCLMTVNYAISRLSWTESILLLLYHRRRQ